jgi:hypothetical protein
VDATEDEDSDIHTPVMSATSRQRQTALIKGQTTRPDERTVERL